MSSWVFGYNYTEGEKPKPARKRFTSSTAIYSIYEQFRQHDVEDEKRRVKILNMYNMRRPFDPEQLKQLGQSWRANVNWGDLKNVVDSRAGVVTAIETATYDLVALDTPIPLTAGPEEERATTVLAEEFSRAIRADGRVVSALGMMNKEADLYGFGPVAWRTPETYVPAQLRRGQVLVDPQGPVSPDDHDIIFIDTVMEAADIFRILDNPDIASKAGWNIPAVRRWAVKVFELQYDTRNNGSVDGGVGYLEALEEASRRNDFYEVNQFRKFHVLDVYIREMKEPRGVTHVIVPATVQGAETDSPDRDFLFEHENAYDRMSEVVNWFVPDKSIAYLKASRGIASDIAPKAALRDRSICAQADAVVRALSMVVKQKNPGASPITSLQEIGPYTIVGQDFDPMPNANQNSNFQGVAQFMQQLDGATGQAIAGTTFGMSVPRLNLGGTAMSKSESEIAERRITQRDENYRSARLAVHRAFWDTTFRRFMKIATGPVVIRKEYPHVHSFVERCEKRGVSVQMMRDILKLLTVDVSREVIIGMDGVTQFLTNMMQQFGGTADEAGRKRLAHDVARVQLGKKLANRYFPIESRDKGPSNDASVATLENNAIQNGQPVLVGPDQNQAAHINVHMQVLQQVQETVQNGLAEAQREYEQNGRMQQDAEGNLAPKVDNPEQLMQVLQAASTHVQEHLQILSADKLAADFVKQVSATLVSLGDVTQALNLAIATHRRVREAEEKRIREQQEALQRQADEAEIAKANHKADLEAENARRKIDLDHQLALERLRMEAEQGQRRLAMEEDQARGKARLEFESARNRAMVESETARRDIARKDAQAGASMRIDQARAAQEANLRASEVAQTRMESRNRLREVTGRNPPRPSDFTEQSAAPTGIVPV